MSLKATENRLWGDFHPNARTSGLTGIGENESHPAGYVTCRRIYLHPCIRLSVSDALRPAYRAVTVEVNQRGRQGMPANNKNRFCDHCVVSVTRDIACHKALRRVIQPMTSPSNFRWVPFYRFDYFFLIEI